MYLILIMSVLSVTSCIQIDTVAPVLKSCFNTDYDTYYTNEAIYFDNCSLYADSYYWDFGDGQNATEQEPMHYYTQPGVYEVALTVYKNRESATSYITITVLQSTNLNVLIKYDGTDTPVENAYIELFENSYDWDNFLNVKASGYTDVSGIVEFVNLKTIRYWVSVEKNSGRLGTYNNNLLNHMTSVLLPGEVNYYVFYVEQVAKKDGTKTLRLVRIVKK